MKPHSLTGAWLHRITFHLFYFVLGIFFLAQSNYWKSKSNTGLGLTKGVTIKTVDDTMPVPSPLTSYGINLSFYDEP